MAWHIGGVELESRFFLGTAGYPSPVVLQQAIAASGAQVGGAVDGAGLGQADMRGGVCEPRPSLEGIYDEA